MGRIFHFFFWASYLGFRMWGLTQACGVQLMRLAGYSVVVCEACPIKNVTSTIVFVWYIVVSWDIGLWFALNFCAAGTWIWLHCFVLSEQVASIPSVGSRVLAAKGWQPRVGSRGLAAEGWQPRVDTRGLADEGWQPRVGSRGLAAEGWQPRVGSRGFTAEGRQPTVGSRGLAESWQPSVGSMDTEHSTYLSSSIVCDTWHAKC